MTKNVNSLLLIVSFLLINDWYLATNHNPILAPTTLISKYPSLTTDFRPIAQHDNPVDIIMREINNFLKPFDNIQWLQDSDHQTIIAPSQLVLAFRPIKQLFAYKIEMTARSNAVFAKTISLNWVSANSVNVKNNRPQKSQLCQLHLMNC